MFIELTDQNGEKFYKNINFITGIYRSKFCSTNGLQKIMYKSLVGQLNCSDVSVQETPEEIMEKIKEAEYG